MSSLLLYKSLQRRIFDQERDYCVSIGRFAIVAKHVGVQEGLLRSQACYWRHCYAAHYVFLAGTVITVDCGLSPNR